MTYPLLNEHDRRPSLRQPYGVEEQLRLDDDSATKGLIGPERSARE